MQATLRHANAATRRRYEMRKAKGEVAQLVGRALTTNGRGLRKSQRACPYAIAWLMCVGCRNQITLLSRCLSEPALKAKNFLRLWAVFCRRPDRDAGRAGDYIDARDLDDGLPRGLLAGAIVEVWLALHLHWA